ncbi:hypothetical protein AQJ46_49015 [Streptomyces canus]|uniref:Uncharacterized protein n=1 Tax=Streptomyces canus TaxID=58343 RepID=A0A101RKH1_9ACTN|nr:MULTISPECIES: hypothetical protein [Streptomyces]KUN56044.1 hypothetical protein AQJ46_49015 [Streptomyces canus]MDI5910143.1 hypothetical protein [Streptomyces sp. 12257]
MGSGHAGRRGIARLLAVCAVLFGLFLMHGAPATAAEGCHGAMPTMALSPITGGHDAALLATHAPAAPAPGLAVRAAGLSGMPGALCVSTPAHERTPLPAPGLLDVAGAAVLTPWMLTRLPAAANWTGRRGPPDSGRDLLLQVCIART